ncbi:tRNA (adenine(22)-N(1))-methyltransferase TrmK [Vibrio sp. ZSDE26]|uniref:tRNA (Adenine(22)-N(1))-methyltransferase TrmK n=1 Tax=Vibrio amylolyticus TaxID=2847292 RepID=A0A9X1XMC9_9VIBR|nr:tRNA (adenine(22)-N(1))-methyltransferase TrmK [Vibrio amylolyticus]
MKISKRLKQVDEMVEHGYDHIWDCCCDHGLLGAQLLSRHAGEHIHFVDIVPGLMEHVESNLNKYYAHSSTPWSTHCVDVAELPLEQHTGRHLIIIAGVGGDLTIEFVKAISNKHPKESIDFLLCPVHHHYRVRNQLRSIGFRTMKEALIEENKRFYEIQLVSGSTRNNSFPLVSPVGIDIWKPPSKSQYEIARRYLTKTLSHYKRISKGDNEETQPIVDAYSSIEVQLPPTIS